MSILTPPKKVKAFCNLVALEKGLDPGGHATPFTTLLVVEAPLPWRRSLFEIAKTMPPEVGELIALYYQRYEETGVWNAPFMLLIAPDEAYSRANHRRVMLYQWQREQAADFSRAEYLIPEEHTGKLIWALLEEPETSARFDKWRTADTPSTRDILVCTHGTVDVACAKFGFPLYHYLRQSHASESLRVWRVSHFGGHVFAPTLMDMPSGRFWAYVEEEQADQIVRQSGPVSDLRHHYRGWAGLANGFLQVAEREMWLREGWRWFDWPKCGEILAQDTADTPAWAEVRILFADDDGQHGYKARVEIVDIIDTIHTTDYEERYPYPQYRVAWIERID